MMMEAFAPPVFPVFEPLLCTFDERTEEPMEKIMTMSVQFATSVHGARTFLQVSESLSNTLGAVFNMACVGAAAVPLPLLSSNLLCYNVLSAPMTLLHLNPCLTALFHIFIKVCWESSKHWLTVTVVTSMAWFSTVHDGQPAYKARRAEEKTEAAKMMEVMAKLCLKNSLEIREMQAAVLRTYLVPQDEVFATAGLDVAKAHMEKAKAAEGNSRKIEEMGLVHAHVWAAIVKVAVDYVAKEDDKTVLQQHFETITKAGSTAAELAFHVHVGMGQEDHETSPCPSCKLGTRT
jgi:hypothetical protein